MNVEELRKSGKKLLLKKDFQGALEKFEALVKTAPHDVTARKQVFQIYKKLGDNDQAVVTLQGIAGIHAARGELLKGIAACKRILEIEPGHRATQRVLSDLYVRQSRAEHPPPPKAMHDAMKASVAHQKSEGATAGVVKSRVAKLQLKKRGESPAGVDPLFVHGIDVQRLTPCPFFSSLGADAFRAFAEHMHLRNEKAGFELIEEGQVGASMYIVVEGEVGILKNVEQEKVEVARLADGAFFGEMALLSDAPRSASVVVREDVTLLELDLPLWRTLLEKFPNVGKVMQRFQVQRLVQNVLQVSSFFLPLHPQIRREMIGKFRMQNVEQGDVLIEKGTRGSGFFIQLIGQSEVVDGSQTLAWLNEADVFGEAALLDDSLTTATVRATTAGSVLRLAPADFLQVIAEHVDAKEALAALKERRQQAVLDAQRKAEGSSLELDGFHI